MTAPETKYCEDCRFCFSPPSGLEFARCTAPGAIRPDGGERFVARKFDMEQHRYASATRSDTEMCSPDANWFQPKTSEAVAA